MNDLDEFHFSLSGQLGAFNLDVTWQGPLQGVHALFGPSGSGKTTLLRAIAGLQRLKGNLSVADRIWQNDAQGVFVPPHQRHLAYVFQHSALLPHRTVAGNLDFALKRVPRAQQRISREAAIELLDIAELLDQRPHLLSGGQRQRVAIARALASSPGLLLMDEPLASLDRPARRAILPRLQRLRMELDIPIIYVSHAVDEVSYLADHLWLLESGRILSSGAVRAMRTRPELALLQGEDADSVFEVKVQGHDEHWHLSRLAFAGGVIEVPRVEAPIGTPLRLRIRASDVSVLTMPLPADSCSILNRFPARVEALLDEGPAQVLVQLTLSGEPLLARITRKSAAALNLVHGQNVQVQVKAVALI